MRCNRVTGATLVSVVREVTGVTGVTGVTEVSGTMWMTEHERSDGWSDGQTNRGSTRGPCGP